MTAPVWPTAAADYVQPVDYAHATGPREEAGLGAESTSRTGATTARPRTTTTPGGSTPPEMA